MAKDANTMTVDTALIDRLVEQSRENEKFRYGQTNSIDTSVLAGILEEKKQDEHEEEVAALRDEFIDSLELALQSDVPEAAGSASTPLSEPEIVVNQRRQTRKTKPNLGTKSSTGSPGRVAFVKRDHGPVRVATKTKVNTGATHSPPQDATARPLAQETPAGRETGQKDHVSSDSTPALSKPLVQEAVARVAAPSEPETSAAPQKTETPARQKTETPTPATQEPDSKANVAEEVTKLVQTASAEAAEVSKAAAEPVAPVSETEVPGEEEGGGKKRALMISIGVASLLLLGVLVSVAIALAK